MGSKSPISINRPPKVNTSSITLTILWMVYNFKFGQEGRQSGLEPETFTTMIVVRLLAWQRLPISPVPPQSDYSAESGPNVPEHNFALPRHLSLHPLPGLQIVILITGKRS